MFTFPHNFKGDFIPKTITYIFGGNSGTGTDDWNSTISKFDGTSRTLMSAVLSTFNARPTSFGLDGLAFNVLGTSAAIQQFDGFYSSTHSATLVGANHHQAASVIASDAYIFGGRNNTNSTRINTIQKFNGTVRSTQGATLQAPIFQSSAATLSAAVYIFGGSADASIEDYIQKYDGTSRTTLGVTLATDNYGTPGNALSSASTLSGNIYIFGGFNTRGIGTLQKFNISSCIQWANLVSSAENYAMASSTLGTSVYIFGGGSSPTTKYNTIQKYNGTTVSLLGATLNSAKDSLGAATINDY